MPKCKKAPAGAFLLALMTHFYAGRRCIFTPALTKAGFARERKSFAGLGQADTASGA